MSSTTSNGPDARAQALVASYVRAGYAQIEPPVLQPAEPFLDLSGEDIRRRMFLTSDPDGRELCLRPDLTIPVSRDYLASPAAGKAAGFCYLGAVFRHREGAAAGVRASRHRILRPRRQGGGRCRNAGARARSDDALRLARAGNPHGRRRIVFRLRRRARSGAGVEAPPGQGFQPQDLAGARSRSDSRSSRPTARRNIKACSPRSSGSDPKAAHHLVTDLLSIAGIAAVGGRSVAEIADRFLEQAALNAPTRLPRETRALIERFLAVRGDPDEAAGELRALAADAKIALGPALDLFETRTGFLAARGVDVRAIKFSTAFGRGFDYYTGFVFELHDPRGKSAAGRRRPL